MKVAVLGTGNVGRALGLGWARSGHTVVFGSRTPDSDEVRALLKEGNGKTGSASVVEAVQQCGVIVVALPWPAAKQILPALSSALSAKIVVDCTNPIAQWPVLDHSQGSGGEQVARMVPESHVVKAFNSTGYDNMLNPRYPEGTATMFFAGDDAEAKEIVRVLITDLSFEAVDCGPLSQSLALETLGSLWGTLAFGQNMGRNIAFRLMRRLRGPVASARNPG